MKSGLDPITLAVLQNGLQQVCNEMDPTFVRSAFSPVISEAMDRSGGIYSPGDVMRVSTPGGGGFGDPFRRDPAKVAQDVARGYYSAEEVERLFGVRLRADGTVDAEASAALRGTKRRVA